MFVRETVSAAFIRSARDSELLSETPHLNALLAASPKRSESRMKLINCFKQQTLLYYSASILSSNTLSSNQKADVAQRLVLGLCAVDRRTSEGSVTDKG